MVRSKRGDSFFLTIGPATWLKSSLGEFFELSGEVAACAIGEERYSEKLDPDTGEVVDGNVGVHHHIYLKTNEKMVCTDVRTMLVESFFAGDEEPSIDVQPCRSAVATLRYLSKEDKCPFLFNVPVSKLSLYARAWHYAKTKYRSIRPVDMSDPFIVSLGPHYRVAVNIVEKHLQDLRDCINRNRVRYDVNYMCGQTMPILDILNGGEHLYLESSPGFGKSELVDKFLENELYFKVNDYNQYCFAGLKESHRYIWFEDFDYEKWRVIVSTLLSMMDKKEVNLQAKYLPDRLTSFPELRFIFTSNFPLGGTSEYFQRRVKYVYVDHRIHGCVCGVPGDVDDLFDMSLF